MYNKNKGKGGGVISKTMMKENETKIRKRKK